MGTEAACTGVGTTQPTPTHEGIAMMTIMFLVCVFGAYKAVTVATKNPGMVTGIGKCIMGLFAKK